MSKLNNIRIPIQRHGIRIWNEVEKFTDNEPIISFINWWAPLITMMNSTQDVIRKQL